MRCRLPEPPDCKLMKKTRCRASVHAEKNLLIRPAAFEDGRLNGFFIFAARLSAAYALSVYLPLSDAAAVLRRTVRRLRHKEPSGAQTRLKKIDWREVLPKSAIRLVETKKRHGNVRISELAILANAAASTAPGSEIFEIGTYDGRTTLNLAINAPEGTPVVTLDLPAGHHTAFQIEPSEQLLVDKPSSGQRIRSCRSCWRSYAKNIIQVFGDSANYDWSLHRGRVGLLFVDGSHSYDYVNQDSKTAFNLMKPGGLVIWHDYGVWEGVTRALEDLEDANKLGLRHLRGTSLVVWRAPQADRV